MSLTKLFSIAVLALVGLCGYAEAQQTVVINFQGDGVIGGILDSAQPQVGGMGFTTALAGDDLMGNPIVVPGFMLTTLGASSDPMATINGTLNNGLGINSDVNSNPMATSEEPAQLDAQFNESLTFTFNQDVTLVDVEFFGISNDAGLGESLSFAGMTLLGSDLGASDTFSFAPNFTVAANTPIVFEELVGNGVAIESLTITVPEPGSLAMLGLGSGLMMLRRRRR